MNYQVGMNYPEEVPPEAEMLVDRTIARKLAVERVHFRGMVAGTVVETAKGDSNFAEVQVAGSNFAEVPAEGSNFAVVLSDRGPEEAVLALACQLVFEVGRIVVCYSTLYLQREGCIRNNLMVYLHDTERNMVFDIRYILLVTPLVYLELHLVRRWLPEV